MLQILPTIGALLLGYTFLMLGFGLLGTLVGLRAVIEQFSTDTIGIVMSSFYVGFVLGALVCDRVIARVGHIRAFAVFAVAPAIATLLLPVFSTAPAWVLARLLLGFGLAGLNMVSESWLNDRADNRTRGQVLSLYMITFYLGAGTGQFLLVLGNPAGFELFSLAAALFVLALVPVAMTRASSPEPVEASRFNPRELWRLSPFAVIGCLANGLILGAFGSMVAVFGRGVGLSNAEIAGVVAAALYGGLALQWPLGRLSDRMDRRIVIILVGIGVALASLALGWLAADPGPGLLVAAALFGGLAYAIYPLAAAHANDFVDSADRVKASAGLLLAFGVGAILGPVFAALAMDAMGAAGLFVFTAAAAALCTLFAAYRMFRRAPLPQAEREDFIALPRSSPLVAYMDPRADLEEDGTDAGPAAAEAAAGPP